MHKLETKIAMEKFEQENLVQNRKRESLKNYIVLKIGTVAALLGLVLGNVYSFATYKKRYVFCYSRKKWGYFQNIKIQARR